MQCLDDGCEFTKRVRDDYGLHFHVDSVLVAVYPFALREIGRQIVRILYNKLYSELSFSADIGGDELIDQIKNTPEFAAIKKYSEALDAK